MCPPHARITVVELVPDPPIWNATFTVAEQEPVPEPTLWLTYVTAPTVEPDGPKMSTVPGVCEKVPAATAPLLFDVPHVCAVVDFTSVHVELAAPVHVEGIADVAVGTACGDAGRFGSHVDAAIKDGEAYTRSAHGLLKSAWNPGGAGHPAPSKPPVAVCRHAVEVVSVPSNEPR